MILKTFFSIVEADFESEKLRNIKLKRKSRTSCET